METSECSSVPYSLSDIQLPESPGSRLKCKDVKSDDKSSIEEASEPIDHQSSPVKSTQSNGDAAPNVSNPSQEEIISESETKEISDNNDFPVKPNQRKDSEEYGQSDESSDSKSDKNNSQYRKKSDESSDSKSDKNNSQYRKESDKLPVSKSDKNSNQYKQKSDESSDSESDKNNVHYRKKSLNSEDTSSNVAADSDEDSSRQNINKEQKSSKPYKQTDESDNEKSTDSEKYRHRQADSKRKPSHDKQKSRKRRSPSQSRSSSTSSSSSSDRSPKRRSSKKAIGTRKKNFSKNDEENSSENDESNHVSNKSSDEEAEKLKKNVSATESSNKIVSNTSAPRRIKIKRDNVPIEKTPARVESAGTASSSKDVVEKISSNKLPENNDIPHSESSEVKKPISEVTYTPRKVILSNRKLNRSTSEDKSNEPKTKKSKWDSFAAVKKTSNTISISTDSLKNWFPDFKLMSEAPAPVEIETDEHEQSMSAVDDKNIVGYSDVSNTNDSVMKQETVSQMEIEDSQSQEPKNEEDIEEGIVSKLIFIQNLVRPFTLNQLKDLLKQNGNIIEEYFWIDKIKSKCFVMYETEKEAIKAKNALNNTRWPSSNPKILSVEFSNEELLEQHKKGNEPPPPRLVLEPPVVVEPVEVVETRVPHAAVEEHKRKERERRRDRDRSKPQAPVREWDKDKVMQESPEREHIVKEEKPKSSDKREKKESRKRPNEDTPAKLLDDLFQKTKSPPCIYWLPLTEEQAKQKEEAKKQRRLEREKRNQQMRDQEADRRNRRDRSSRRSREKENRKSSTRSRSPATRRR